MKIINIPLFQLAIFKVENELHITVSSTDFARTIDANKLHSEQFNKSVQNEFQANFNRPITHYHTKTAPSLFNHSIQIQIIILK